MQNFSENTFIASCGLNCSSARLTRKRVQYKTHCSQYVSVEKTVPTLVYKCVWICSTVCFCHQAPIFSAQTLFSCHPKLPFWSAQVSLRCSSRLLTCSFGKSMNPSGQPSASRVGPHLPLVHPSRIPSAPAANHVSWNLSLCGNHHRKLVSCRRNKPMTYLMKLCFSWEPSCQWAVILVTVTQWALFHLDTVLLLLAWSSTCFYSWRDTAALPLQRAFIERLFSRVWWWCNFLWGTQHHYPLIILLCKWVVLHVWAVHDSLKIGPFITT